MWGVSYICFSSLSIALYTIVLTCCVDRPYFSARRSYVVPLNSRSDNMSRCRSLKIHWSMRYCNSDLDRLYLSVFFRKVYHLHADKVCKINFALNAGADFRRNNKAIAHLQHINANVQFLIKTKFTVFDVRQSKQRT